MFVVIRKGERNIKKPNTKFKKGCKDFTIITVTFLITYFLITYIIDGSNHDIEWGYIVVWIFASLVTIIIMNSFKE